MQRKKMQRTRRIRTNKRSVKYEMPKDAKINYKDIALLQKFLTDRGKLLSRRITGITGIQQRKLTNAVKKSRFLGLLSVGAAKRR